MKANRRKRNNAGFSLAETLMAVLILLMVSAIVASGMPMAREAYEKAVDAANAQTLLSTTISMLRSELSEAQNFRGNDANTELHYRNPRSGVETTLSVGEEDIEITQLDITRPIVTRQAATKRLNTSYASIKFENGIVTITNLCVTRRGTVVASLDKLQIMPVNP